MILNVFLCKLLHCKPVSYQILSYETRKLNWSHCTSPFLGTWYPEAAAPDHKLKLCRAEVQRAGSTVLVLDQLSCPTTPIPHALLNCSSGHNTSLFKPHVSPAPFVIKPQSARERGPTWPSSPAPPSSQCPHLCLESGHTHAPATRPALTSRVSLTAVPFSEALPGPPYPSPGISRTIAGGSRV